MSKRAVQVQWSSQSRHVASWKTVITGVSSCFHLYCSFRRVYKQSLCGGAQDDVCRESDHIIQDSPIPCVGESEVRMTARIQLVEASDVGLILPR